MKGIKLICLLIIIPSLELYCQPTAIPTFNCIGLYWAPAGGSASNVCAVQYKKSTASTWSNAQNLWWDDRTNPGPKEYRGSIVNLIPNTTYDIKVSIPGETKQIQATTWNESFNVTSTVTLNPTYSSTYTVSSGGSAGNYKLYDAASSGTTIDVNNNSDYCIYVQASFVIIRGVKCLDGRINGIRIANNCKNVVIENCDISNWGRQASSGPFAQQDDGIYADGIGIERLIIQRNKIHHPRYDCNSWCELTGGGYDASCNTHPFGGQAIFLKTTGGNHVIRYNEIYGDATHYFNDGIGGEDNYSNEGAPNKDSDIYGNMIKHCWDDGIEAEGANKNVRIWGNFEDSCYTAVAVAATHSGPCYIWRNVFANNHKNGFAGADPDDHNRDRGGFVKTQYNSTWGGGKCFVYHNTILQPPPATGKTRPLGAITGIGHGGELYNFESRNNIIEICANWWNSIEDLSYPASNNWDYDLYNGDLGNATAGSESNGIVGQPTYVNPTTWLLDANKRGDFYLSGTGNGFDDGLKLDNFNDCYSGTNPDMGAHESGSGLMEFGVNANWKIYDNCLPVGLQEGNAWSGVVVYPNPFNSSTVLSVSGAITPGNAIVRIYDLCGKPVRTIPMSSNEVVIDRAGLTSGIYFYSITSDSESIGKGKLVIQ